MRHTHRNPLRALFGAALAAFLIALSIQPARAQAQDPPGTNGEPDQNTKAMYYSLYYEEFKNGNYEAALPNLRWILEHAPTFPSKDARNFERAITLYDSLSARADDPALQRAYLDTALVMFDTAVSTLQDEGSEVNLFEWTLNKGRFIQSHPNVLSDQQGQVAELYRKAYELNGEELDPYYIQILIADYVQKGDKEGAIQFMEEVEQRFPDSQELTDYIAQMRNSLFKSPEERMAFLESQLEKNPEDMEIITELFDIYKRLGLRDKIYTMGDQLLQRTPTPAVYRTLAKMRLDDAEAAEALALYEKALAMPGATPTAQDYYNMGIAQQQLGSLSKARTYFRQALEVDPNYGLAYIAIADLYAQAVSECGGAMERDDKAVYWLVVDYLQRAKNADSSVASAANNRISTYSRYFPSAEDKFFKGWNPGDKITINYGCYGWIGEATTVR